MNGGDCKILSSVDEIQHMNWIKCITEILEWFTVVALSAAVQPDGDQCQKRKPLLAQFKFHAKELNRIHQTAQQFHIQPV